MPFLWYGSRCAFVCFLLLVLLGKVFTEKTIAIIIIPNWPSKHWYPRILSLATTVLKIKSQESNLYLTHKPSVIHPLTNQLELLAIKLILKLLSEHQMHSFVKLLELNTTHLLDSRNRL